MRWWSSCAVVLLSVIPALAADPARTGLERLQTVFPGTQAYAEEGRLARLFGVPFSFGASPEASAELFVQNHADVFGLSPGDLVPGNSFNRLYSQPVMYDPQTGRFKFTLLYYGQQRDGVPVYRSELRLLIRNEPGFPLIWAGSSLKDIGEYRVPAGAAASINEGVAHAAALAAVPGLKAFTPGEFVIFAGLNNERVAPRAALSFVGDNRRPASADEQRWLFVADAASGEILYRENLIVHEDVTGTVQGVATPIPKADICTDEEPLIMPHAKVAIGTTIQYANAQGMFTIPNQETAPVAVTSYMAGRYFVVNDVGGPLETLTLTVEPPGPADFLHNEANTNEFVRAQVNGYIQANVARDFTLAQNPYYPVIYNQFDFPVNVNINSSCNAYYNGTSINFFRALGGCPNTAFSSVVHHEYGHHLVNVGGSGQGQYGEGMSDCLAMLIADDPILGYGFLGNCDEGIRSAMNALWYPCGGEIHACGQLLSGCVWDTRVWLWYAYPDTYLDIIRPLTINSILLHDGDLITPSITIDFLTLDDDDAYLYNATPHWGEICMGFGGHYMFCPQLDLLGFTFPNGRPELLNPDGGSPIRVNVFGLNGDPQPGTGTLHYKVGDGDYQSVPMTMLAPHAYEVLIPELPCGALVSYYVSANTTAGATVTNPIDAPASAYTAMTGYSVLAPFAYDFEAADDQGWTVGDAGDNATAGLWNRADPEGTPAQPETDKSTEPGALCWVTDSRAGSSVNTYDVDGGKTTLKSPLLDLSSFSVAKLSYWRWYSNDKGSNPNSDTFRVDISSDGGATWTNLETVGPTGFDAAGGWYAREASLTAALPLTAQVQLRFVAEDADASSTVEAAIDEVFIRTTSCTPPFARGDVNCSGSVGVDDINAFVTALSSAPAYWADYPSCYRSLADVNENGVVDFGDINPFVALVGGGS